MGGKAHGGRRVERGEAIQIYSDLTGFGPTGCGNWIHQSELCGSYRRGKPDCGDLDIVVVPEDHDTFDAWCVNLFGYQKSGKPARNGLYKGVQVEFYVAKKENLGTFLQMWTGSMQHNVLLRKAALKLGYSMSQYGFRNESTGELTLCQSEDDVYKFLGVEFVPPNMR